MNSFALAVAAVISGCSCTGAHHGTKSASGAPPICDALVLSAQESDMLRDLAAVQFASADHATALWERWRNKLVPGDADADVKYSGAGDRANQYRGTALALRSASLLLDAGLNEAVQQLHTAKLRDAEDQLEKATGWFMKLPPTSSEPAAQATAVEQWSAHSSSVRDAENAIIDACYEQTGGKSPHFHLPPMLLPSE